MKDTPAARAFLRECEELHKALIDPDHPEFDADYVHVVAAPTDLQMKTSYCDRCQQSIHFEMYVGLHEGSWFTGCADDEIDVLPFGDTMCPAMTEWWNARNTAN
jgi:hypothetical protein